MAKGDKKSTPLTGECQLAGVEAPKIGRPAVYGKDTRKLILSLLMQGKTLAEICTLASMPHYSTVCDWLAADSAFADKYARAREVQADYFADEIVSISDIAPIEPHDVGWAKNRIDARKWHTSKTAPKKYGDKIALAGDKDNPLNVNISNINSMTDSEIEKELARYDRIRESA
jgi:hypothetical protein